MERKARWQEIDAMLLGLSVLTALHNLELGKHGETLVELEPELKRVIEVAKRNGLPMGVKITARWLKIVSDPETGRLVIFEVEDPTGKSR